MNVVSTLKKHDDLSEGINIISGNVIDCIFQVHKNLGAGYLERVYEECLCLELSKRSILFQRQYPLNLVYGKDIVDVDFRLDLVVDNAVLVELKAVEKLLPVHEAQIYSYLKMSGFPVGILVNFNVPLIKDGLKRFVSKKLRDSVTPRSTVEGPQS
jgi:GxxExxY protein